MAASWFPLLLSTHFRETELLPTLQPLAHAAGHVASAVRAARSRVAQCTLPPDRCNTGPTDSGREGLRCAARPEAAGARAQGGRSVLGSDPDLRELSDEA